MVSIVVDDDFGACVVGNVNIVIVCIEVMIVVSVCDSVYKCLYVVCVFVCMMV